MLAKSVSRSIDPKMRDELDNDTNDESIIFISSTISSCGPLNQIKINGRYYYLEREGQLASKEKYENKSENDGKTHPYL